RLEIKLLLRIGACCHGPFQASHKFRCRALFEIDHVEDVDSYPICMSAWSRFDVFQSRSRFAESAEITKDNSPTIPREDILREVLDGAVVGRKRLVETAHGAQRFRTAVLREGMLGEILDRALVGRKRVVETAHNAQRFRAATAGDDIVLEVLDGALVGRKRV